MAIKYIDIRDLHDNAFVGEQSGGQIKILHKIDPARNNMLKMTANGLKVEPVLETPTRHRVSYNSSVSTPNELERGVLNVLSNGFGYLHLDFTTRNRTGAYSVGTLPANAPVPRFLSEQQVVAGGEIFLTAGSRSIQVQNIPANRRVIVDIVGFWS